MQPFAEFNIPFSGLKQGVHPYSFEIDSEFFSQFDTTDLQNGLLELDFSLHKQSAMLTLNFLIYGWVEIPCDRCGNNFRLPLEDKRSLFVKFGEGYYEESDDIITLPEKAHEINIAHYIYEFIHLALPLKRVHPEGECDTEALNRLDNLAVQEIPDDPRWDALNQLKDK